MVSADSPGNPSDLIRDVHPPAPRIAVWVGCASLALRNRKGGVTNGMEHEGWGYGLRRRNGSA